MDLDIFKISCIYIAGISSGIPFGWYFAEKKITKGKSKMNKPAQWQWIHQQKSNQLTVGDKAEINGVQYTLLHFNEETGEGIWDDMQYKNIQDERPPPNSIVRVRYLNDIGGWTDQAINEKHIDKIKSERIEWMSMVGEAK